MPSFSRPGSPHSSIHDRNPSPVRSLIGHSTMMSSKDGVSESQETESMRRVLDQLDERNKQLRECSSQLDEKNRQLSDYFTQLDEKNKQLAASYAQLQERTDRARKLEKELEDAHDFIFTLQPKRQVISAENAAAAFKTLCGSVEEWVQTNLRDVLDNQVKLNSKDFTLDDVATFMDLVSSEGRKYAASIPETDEYNIIAAIMTFLDRKIFAEKFWFPMHGGASDFLDRLEADMYQLEPRRGKSLQDFYPHILPHSMLIVVL
jgi:hypothetical protein